ncbi:MAG: polysaccharide biosynthesis protein PslG [Candidatus Sumerlaeota bacterium]|nr:polysaccharide biosynthesis protein PslG [Candidatus Sumerlaeota bacterium]
MQTNAIRIWSLAGGLAAAASVALAAAPVPGVDVNPFGSQTVWPVDPNLTTFNSRLQETGVGFARFDLCWWSLAEKVPGEYDFTSPDFPGYEGWDTDAAIADLRARGIEPFPILCYGNPHYNNQQGPYTDAGRTAFGNYCYAAASRYKDSVDYWEIWNEPNLEFFWATTPNAANYARLVAAAAPRIRAANPDAVIAGGAVSGIDQTYLETAFQNGLLDHIDVLTIHPYRINAPESINTEVAQLRARMANHTSRDIPIWTGEWGYNTAWTEVTPTGQAKCLARMMVNNLSIGIQNSIWFSVHPFKEAQTGDDPEWALVDYELAPRPSYYALKTVNERLAAPVAVGDDPFQVRCTGTIPSFRSAVFQRGSSLHSTVVVWQALWPLSDSYAGVSTTLSLDLPANASIQAYDGLTGSPLTLSRSHSNGVTALSDFVVKDYPIYLDITLPPPVVGDVWSATGE